MAVNKVEYAGKVLLDLTGDTVSESTLKKGVTAHDKSGKLIVGTMTGGDTNNNIEAYLVSVSDPVVSFKTQTGTIKAYGYAYSSDSSRNVWAFDGTRYCKSRGVQSPSTYNISLGISSSGRLTGLPSEINRGTLLVTRGLDQVIILFRKEDQYGGKNCNFIGK